MPFVLEFTESALGDLDFFRKFEQTLILHQVHVQLTHQPTAETRNRKSLEHNALVIRGKEFRL